jgi:hypothetical protein
VLSPSSKLTITCEGFVVVTRSQTFEEPNIQRSGVRRRTDVPIGGTISLFKISHLHQVGTRLNTYQNMLHAFNSGRLKAVSWL